MDALGGEGEHAAREAGVIVRTLVCRFEIGAAAVVPAALAHAMGPRGLAAVGTCARGESLELPVSAALVSARSGNSSLGYGSHNNLSVALFL